MSDFFKESDCNGYGTYKCDDLAEIACIVDRGTMISLDKANRLVAEFLSKGTVVYGAIHNKDRFGWQMHEKQTEEYKRYDTHRALLINIEPIERDSAEKIAKDLADYKFDHEVGLRFREFVDRARKLQRGEK